MNDIKAIRLFNIYGFSGMSYAGNVWDINGICPTLNTMTGGNRQPLILEKGKYMDKIPCEFRYDEGIRFFENDTIGTLRTISECGNKHIVEADSITNEGGRKRMIKGNVRIRKLTPTECYKLMGFTAEDCKKCSEGGISNSQLYKQAGNSIVVNVLEAIFTSLGECYEEFQSNVS